MNEEITFIYTVGGGSEHYENMERSINSIERLRGPSKFLIIEFGEKLKNSKNREIISLPKTIDFSAGKKVGYIIWKHKYVAALKVKTKFGIYVDTDTVMVNDTIKDIISLLDGGVGVSQHFWVPTISHYEKMATNKETFSLFKEAKALCGLKDTDGFFAGGVFIFENNERCKEVFKEVLRLYDEFYNDESDYVKSVTDELFLAAALAKNDDLIRPFGGALNHCCMGDNHMPLIWANDKFYGRNPWDKDWDPITFFHCNVARRDPAENYKDEEMSKRVREAWGI